MRIQKMDSNTNCTRPQTSFKQILVGNEVVSPEMIKTFFAQTLPKKEDMDIFQKAIENLVKIDEKHNAGKEKEFVMNITRPNRPDALAISIGTKGDKVGLLPTGTVYIHPLDKLSESLEYFYNIYKP